eukprot:s805_g3.t1
MMLAMADLSVGSDVDAADGNADGCHEEGRDVVDDDEEDAGDDGSERSTWEPRQSMGVVADATGRVKAGLQWRQEGRVRSVTLGEMPASFEQLLEELRHTHQMELAELKAEADRLLVEKKTWTATTERSRSQKAAREADDDEESDTTLPDPNLFSSEKVVPLETFLEAEEFPRSPSEGEAEILDSMAVSAPFENKIDIQEEIENAKPWMDEEGIKHYKLKASLHNQNP